MLHDDSLTAWFVAEFIDVKHSIAPMSKGPTVVAEYEEKHLINMEHELQRVLGCELIE